VAQGLTVNRPCAVRRAGGAPARVRGNLFCSGSRYTSGRPREAFYDAYKSSNQKTPGPHYRRVAIPLKQAAARCVLRSGDHDGGFVPVSTRHQLRHRFRRLCCRVAQSREKEQRPAAKTDNAMDTFADPVHFAVMLIYQLACRKEKPSSPLRSVSQGGAVSA
jgi:hypothetical protein